MAVGQPEICVSVEDGIPFSSEWICEFFESEVAEGRRFRAGETVQIGWMVTMLKERADGMLELWEPDFASIPITWRRGATSTLRHMEIQRAISDEFDFLPHFASLEHAAVVGKSFFDAWPDITLARDVPEGANTGWVFRARGSDEVECSYKSLYEIALACPSIIPFMALPPGIRVVCSGTEVTVAFGEDRITSRENEILRKIAESNICGFGRVT